MNLGSRYASPCRSLGVAFLSLVLWASPQALASEIVDFIVRYGHAEWSPLVEADELVLRIASPDGAVREYRFSGREHPSVVFQDRQQWPDGVYIWEIVALRGAARSESTSGAFWILGGAGVPNGLRDGEDPGLRNIAEPDVRSVVDQDQQIGDDLIATGNACIGTDCQNGESFDSQGQDTLWLKQAVVRLEFQDTSSGVGMPANDWELIANDPGSSEANKFSVKDLTGDTTPFTILAGAPNHSLFVSSNGRIGIGLSTPARPLHVKTTGTAEVVEVENNGPAQFRFTNSATAEAWNFGHQSPSGTGLVFSDAGDAFSEMLLDVNGNLDLLGSFKLGGGAWRLTPATGPSSLAIDDLVAGTTLFKLNNPASLTTPALAITQNAGTLVNMLRLTNSGGVQFLLDRTDSPGGIPANDWQFSNFNSSFQISIPGSPAGQFTINQNGQLGLNTTPSTELHVASSTLPELRLQQISPAQIWDVQGDHQAFSIEDVTNGKTPLKIAPSAPTSSVEISADGNVGIGGSPSYLIHARNRAANTNTNVVMVTSSDGGNLMRLFETTNTGATFSLYDNAANEDFRLSSEGDSWITSAGQFSVGCQAATFDFEIAPTGATPPSCASATTYSRINAGSATFTASSSRSIKENIAPVEVANLLDTVLAIGVYQYDFIGGAKNRVGLMAEDFHRVFERGSDKEIDGQEVEMALWLAVQELGRRNEQLAHENHQLAERLAAIEARLAH